MVLNVVMEASWGVGYENFERGFYFSLGGFKMMFELGYFFFVFFRFYG